MQRPIVLTGIGELTTRGDLLDRAIVLSLPTISTHTRQDEARFWAHFDTLRPQLLGALLDVISAAFRTLQDIHLPEPPRMADFARWASAAAAACHWSVETSQRTPTKGTNINAQTVNPLYLSHRLALPRGVTPLILAVVTNKPTHVAILLQHGADLSIQDESGKTAWDYVEALAIRLYKHY